MVIATHNRAKLLRRSLVTYMNQTLPREDFELIISDDMSRDDTAQVIEEFRDQLNIIHNYLENPSHKFRSQSAGWNVGLSLAEGEICVFSHPEILMPKGTLEKLYKTVKGFKNPVFVTMKPYFLSAGCQAKLDTVNWEEELEFIRAIPEFYTDSWSDGGKSIWTNRKIEDPKLKWESNTTFAIRREHLLSIGGFREFDRWGPDDPDLLKRRQKLRIPTVVITDMLNYHQNHDDVSKPERKHDFKIPWYLFKRQAKMKLQDHHGEYRTVSSYRR